MKKYLPILKKCPLFAGIGDSDLETLLDCLSASSASYEKNSFVFRMDDTVTAIGIVLSGRVHVLKEDFWGNRTILNHIEPGGLFAEAFSCAEIPKLPVSVIAVEKSEILLVDYRRIIGTCPSACAFHAGLIQNMIRILAGKNIMLTQKLEYVTRRTTREKLLSYFSAQARQAGGNAFEIPYNRQELADYLSVDRSAMSGELCRMRDDGILRFRKNSFELLNSESR